jgi:hypothetical protein
MPQAAITTQAIGVRESYDAALRTFHETVRHNEIEEN